MTMTSNPDEVSTEAEAISASISQEQPTVEMTPAQIKATLEAWDEDELATSTPDTPKG